MFLVSVVFQVVNSLNYAFYQDFCFPFQCTFFWYLELIKKCCAQTRD